MACLCSSCREPLPENARFCTNCGARATLEQVGTTTASEPDGFPICGHCGLAAPVTDRFCSVCDSPLESERVIAPAMPSDLLWAAVSVRFECRACRQLSPLNSLDLDGQVKCAHCGVEQRFDSSRWQGVLSYAAEAAAMGRASRVAAGFGEPGRDAAYTTRTIDAVEVRAGAGHPLCEQCSVPLRIANTAPGVLTMRCPNCSAQRAYAMPSDALTRFSSLRGAICAEHEVGRRDVTTGVDPGGTVVVRCGNCSAPLQISEGRSVVHCAYCGVACRLTPEALWRMGAKSLRADWWWLLFAAKASPGEVLWEQEVSARIVSGSKVQTKRGEQRPAQSGRGCGLFLVMFVAVPAIGAGIYYVGRGALGSGAAQLVERASWNGVRRPLAYDVNADGVLDVVGSVRTIALGDTIRLAAFDGKTGKNLWRSGVVGTYSEAGMCELELVKDTLLLPQDGGVLRSFSIGDGTPGFNIRLNENIDRLCDAQQPTEVLVLTKDKQQHTLNLRTGAIESVAAASECRSNRSSGSAPTVYDVFSDRLPPLRDKVPGLYSDKVLEFEGADVLLALGHKNPGTRVPKLAALRKPTGAQVAPLGLRDVLWVSDVPGVDALSVREGALDVNNISVNGDTVVAVYQMKDAAHQFRLTALSLATGKRLWDSPIEDESPFSGLAATPTHVFVSRWNGLFAFDLHTGQLAYKIE